MPGRVIEWKLMEEMTMPTFSTAEWNGMRLHVLPTRQFKTFSIAMYIGIPLKEETVTRAALIPHVLRRGNERYPETKQFRERLDDLYGAGFGFDIVKRGNYQIIILRMDVVNDAFVSGESESLLDAALQFLSDTVTRPVLEQGAFRASYVTSEKETLRKRIEAIVNNKIQYAAERCIAEMCRDEPYRLLALGRVEDLEDIDPAGLYAVYEDMLQCASIDLYIVGDTTPEAVQALLDGKFGLSGRASAVPYVPVREERRNVEEREVVERMDVKQGKLNLGLRANVTYADDDYPAALIYNGILGGFPHSKLFIHVRERASLAYYASSRFDGHKGLLMIQTGIEIANKEKAESIIRKQLEDIRNGVVSDDELSKTKAMIINSLRENDDSAFDQIGYHFNSVLSGKERSKQELIEAIQATGLGSVVDIARNVELDTVYFLRDKGGAS